MRLPIHLHQNDYEKSQHMNLDSKTPEGPLSDKWDNHRFSSKLVNPANKRKYKIIVVGSGLAGGSAAATLGELGYNVDCFCSRILHGEPIPLPLKEESTQRKTIKMTVTVFIVFFMTPSKVVTFVPERQMFIVWLRVNTNIIDQCVAQGVPFAREYGGLLANRSFGGAQVSRTFYARGQTGQQLLLGAYSALSRQISSGQVKMHTREEMLDIVVVDGHAKGIITRNLATGETKAWTADAVLLCTGGYGNVYYLSTNAIGCNVTATFRAYRRGAGFANPCFTQIHPTCIPVAGDHQSKLTLMSESLK